MAARGKQVSLGYQATVTATAAAAAASGCTRCYRVPRAVVWPVGLCSHGPAGSQPVLILPQIVSSCFCKGVYPVIQHRSVYVLCFLFLWKQQNHSHCLCPVLTKAWEYRQTLLQREESTWIKRQGPAVYFHTAYLCQHARLSWKIFSNHVSINCGSCSLPERWKELWSLSSLEEAPPTLL